MRNIELKAHLRDRQRALEVCEELSATTHGDIRQTDVYFPVEAGRFKLRISEPGDDHLVFYRRPDAPGPKGCDYVLHTVDGGMREVLSAALGELAVVEKVRTLFLWENVRIHLDRVVGLGDFIEFEAVLGDGYDDADGEGKVARLRDAFGIGSVDLVEVSYLDLVLGSRS